MTQQKSKGIAKWFNKVKGDSWFWVMISWIILILFLGFVYPMIF